MDAAEIDVYQQKLSEVELALSADPSNTELQQLKTEIESLLSLSAQLHPAAPRASSKGKPRAPDGPPQTDAHKWQIGDTCEARFSDEQYYPARVVSVLPDGIYKLTFVGYGDMQDTRASDMRIVHAPAATQPKKVAKKAEKRKKHDSAQSGQQAWLKFAKGKKLKAKPINDRSIFKSPETTTGKVGVANSGRGVTKNRRPTKLL
ncbi:hypothetical protein IWW50_004528 [Coemansia erecta]|nr:hypothetical protein GGF43_005249 [Coemansia sp. RSA 2618]KAJ2821708.1 hypothetical protein IWW50_004528 [Coemansia erecta]